jgi:hypothetical protein
MVVGLKETSLKNIKTAARDYNERVKVDLNQKKSALYDKLKGKVDIKAKEGRSAASKAAANDKRKRTKADKGHKKLKAARELAKHGEKQRAKGNGGFDW